jgi:hypothetical protein
MHAKEGGHLRFRRNTTIAPADAPQQAILGEMELDDLRLIATQLAVRGRSREETSDYLQSRFGNADYGEILDGIFPPVPAL